MILSDLINVENAINLDYRILSGLGLFLSLGLIFIALGIRRFIRGKFITSSIQVLSGTSLFLAGLLMLSIATNLYSYGRLTYEQYLADLTIKQVAKKQFLVKINYQNEDKTDEFLIYGDEWQIDARVIKWHGWAQLLGLNAQYRLERISGRYSDIDDEREKPRSVYSLGQKDKVDYWKLIGHYKKWLSWVDAYYGSATYLPMADAVIYSLSITQTGLIARPKNIETNEKLKRW